MGSMDGIIIGVLAFFFFGAIEIGVIWLSYVIANVSVLILYLIVSVLLSKAISYIKGLDKEQ